MSLLVFNSNCVKGSKGLHSADMEALMRNLEISCPLVDGSTLPFEFDSGRDLIHHMIGDDWGGPLPHSLQIMAHTDDGRSVHIVIPYTEGNEAVVLIEEPKN